MSGWIEGIARDVRHGWRAIRRTPLVAAIVVLSLGAGVGANTVVFSWIEAIVLDPVPGVADASGLNWIEPRTESGAYPGASWPEYTDLRGRLRTFRDLVAFRSAPLYVGDPGQVERAYGLLVSGNYFTALGLTPSAGRLLTANDALRPGGEPVVVISHAYWQNRFQGTPAAIGQLLRVNGQDLTIVGVAPPGFQGTVLRMAFDLWVPATLAPVLTTGSNELDDRTSRGYSLLGRPEPTANRARAQADVDSAMRDLARTFPQTNSTIAGEVMAYWQYPRGPARFMATALAIMQGVMLLLLLAVCANTANLVLARASARQREMSMRLALGAGRSRIVSLLVTESLLLALGGGAVGAAFAVWGTNAMNRIPLRLAVPVTFESHVDLKGLLFALTLAIVCGLAFGLVPALHLARLDAQIPRTTSTTTAPRGRLRSVLMAAEVAVALVVLVAAGLFLQSFLETRSIDPGFRREGVLLAAYDLSGRNASDADARTFADRLLKRVREAPDVQAAAVASAVPLDIHGMPVRYFTLDGRTRTEPGFDQALANTVTRGYFDVLGIPFEAGADFAELTDRAAPPQAIVNSEFVRRYIGDVPASRALGRTIVVRNKRYTIVGVVRTTTYEAFGERPKPIIYYSFRDRPPSSAEIHVRTAPGGEATASRIVRFAVRDLDPSLPVYNVRTLPDHIENNLIFRRIPARMFAVLGPLLLIVAAIGIYGVVAYSVSLRTAEIGVRLALGGTTRRVTARIVYESLLVVGAGASIGWLIAFAGTLEIVPGGPMRTSVFAGVPALLLAVAAFACWLPVRRATGIDPVVALRHD